MSEKFGGGEFTNLKKNNGEFSFDYKAPEKIFGKSEITNLKKNNNEFSFDYKAPEKIDVEVSSNLSQLKDEINGTITLPVTDIDGTEKIISVPMNNPVFTWGPVGVPDFIEDKNLNGTNINEILSSMKEKGIVSYEDIKKLTNTTIHTIYLKTGINKKRGGSVFMAKREILSSFELTPKYIYNYKEFITIFEKKLNYLGVLEDWKELIASPKPNWLDNKKEIYGPSKIIKTKEKNID